MKLTRLIELSLFYRLHELFELKKTGEQPASADNQTYNLKYSNIRTNNNVVIYLNGVQITTGFTIDYVNGIIRFDSAKQSTDIITVDYWYCPVNIYDEGKNPKSDDFKYPAVAVFEDVGSSNPFELGNSNKERVTTWILEVWSERGGERNDMTDSIIDLFNEDIRIIDYNNGFPTNRDGTKNESFDNSDIFNYATCDSINYHKGGSLDIGDKPKYLSQIFIRLRISPL